MDDCAQRHAKATSGEKLHVVFSGGVTGGHLFPGLAVAQELRAAAPHARITFAGSGRSFDQQHVVQAGYSYLTLDCPRWPRSWKEVCSFPLRLAHGYRAAVQFLHSTGANVAVGLGGYASVPLALAAAHLDLPLVLLEQNAVVGRANRHLIRFATVLCHSFPLDANTGSIRKSPACPTVLTGTPVRAASRISSTDVRQRRTLLVMGGSSGARLLNQAVPRALIELRDALDGWHVVHQTGEPDHAATVQAYQAAGVTATVAPFFEDLPERMQLADLAICRAGGSTLAELAVAALPAVLVPWEGALDNHQRCNADAFAAAGAVGVVEAAANPAAVTECLVWDLRGLISSPQRRGAMREGLTRLATPRAAHDVSQIVMGLAQNRCRLATPGHATYPPSLLCIDSQAA